MVYVSSLSPSDFSHPASASRNVPSDGEWTRIANGVKLSHQAPSTRSNTFAHAGAIGGGTVGAIEGVAIGAVEGGVLGGVAGSAVAGVAGLFTGGPPGAAAGVVGGFWPGATIGGLVVGTAEGVALGRRGALEGAGVGRDFGNWTFDITHSGPLSDLIATDAGEAAGLLTAPFARHDYDPSQSIVVKAARLGVKVAGLAMKAVHSLTTFLGAL